MKKIILLAFTVLIMVGCVEKNNDGSIVLDRYQKDGSIDNPYLVIIDSCEYIKWYSKMAHKGNCRFCKERRQKEMEELVIKLKEK